VRADALRWLGGGEGGRRRYDLIFVAPPTYSRSKAMSGDFDVQRDYGPLLSRCARALAPGGEILFSTNLRSFVLDARAIPDLMAREISEDVTPPDFESKPRQRAWVVGRKRARSTRASPIDPRG